MKKYLVILLLLIGNISFAQKANEDNPKKSFIESYVAFAETFKGADINIYSSAMPEPIPTTYPGKMNPTNVTTSTSGNLPFCSMIMVYNSGATAGTFDGQALPSHVAKMYPYIYGGTSNIVYYRPTTYDATGTTFLITYLVGGQ